MEVEASIPQHREEDLRALIYTYNNYKATTAYKKGHVVCMYLDNKSVLTCTMRQLQALVDQNTNINYKYNRKTLLSYINQVIYRVKKCLPGKIWSNTPGKQCIPEQEWSNILHFLEEPFRIPFSWGNLKGNQALQKLPVSIYQLAHVSKAFKAVHGNKGEELMDGVSTDEGRAHVSKVFKAVHGNKSEELMDGVSTDEGRAHVSKAFKAVHGNKSEELMDGESTDEGKKCIATPEDDASPCINTRKFKTTCNKSVAVNTDRKVNTGYKRKNKKIKITPSNEGANPVETSNDKLTEINKQLRAKIAKYQNALNDPKIKRFKYLDKKIERLLARRLRRRILIKNLKRDVSILRSKHQKQAAALDSYEKHLQTQRQKIDELKIDYEKKSLELDMLQKTFKEQFHSINRLKRELVDVRKLSDNAQCELEEAREELIREELAEGGAY
ncbi:uncharacterized protein LOC131958237 [Physella acuta]|uniref:uncharacterized protein LOC131958237 n=1 Tax=Physella acuta TaxID=109671 RepID=UPI0027DAC287|nr:uncharacterized protein LOC131958237 [Physella acuta]